MLRGRPKENADFPSWHLASAHLVHRCEHALGGCSADFYGVCAVCEDLWLHNGHQAIFLADAGIARQAVRILVNSQQRWGACADLEHSAPLGEARALLVVFCAPLAQVIKALQACDDALMLECRRLDESCLIMSVRSWRLQGTGKGRLSL